jgi:hypothetical protein
MWTIFRHTKGMLYLRVGGALHSESCEPLEVYRALYDNDLSPMWARPRQMFYEDVAAGTKRFTELGKVRAAAFEDKATLSSFESDLAVPNWTSTAPFSCGIHDLLSVRPTNYIFELTTGEAVATISTFRPTRGVVGIFNLGVRREHRGVGYGSTLIRAAMEVSLIETEGVRFIASAPSTSRILTRLGFKARPEDSGGRLSRPLFATGDEALGEVERDWLYYFASQQDSVNPLGILP